MQTERLLKNMADQVKELQIKLDYVRETVRLYYPASSLNALLRTDFSDDKAGREALRAALEKALWETVPESEDNIEERAAEQNPENGSMKEVWWKKTGISVHGDRFEINIPPEGAEYIHQNYKATSFLQELVELFQNHHHCTLEEICEVFARAVKVEERALKETSLKESVQNKGLSAELELDTSDLGYVCEKMPEGTDFDYVIYFKDLSIDEYYYCIKMEMGHTIYHRFMKEDYEALFS